MYWGATEEARPTANDPKRRSRKLTTIGAVLFLSVGGTVAMASATTVHANPASATQTTVPAVSIPAAFDVESLAPHHAPRVTTAPKPQAAPVTHKVKPAPIPERAAVVTALHTRSTVPAQPALAAGGGCAAALAYLQTHSAPGFQFECPGYALGHQAMTCINVSGVCPGIKLIVISNPCQAAYMNEAHNSWVLSGLQQGSIDPYGYCHS